MATLLGYTFYNLICCRRLVIKLQLDVVKQISGVETKNKVANQTTAQNNPHGRFSQKIIN